MTSNTELNLFILAALASIALWAGWPLIVARYCAWRIRRAQRRTHRLIHKSR